LLLELGGNVVADTALVDASPIEPEVACTGVDVSKAELLLPMFSVEEVVLATAVVAITVGLLLLELLLAEEVDEIIVAVVVNCTAAVCWSKCGSEVDIISSYLFCLCSLFLIEFHKVGSLNLQNVTLPKMKF
jgi:hypothetical protein